MRAWVFYVFSSVSYLCRHPSRQGTRSEARTALCPGACGCWLLLDEKGAQAVFCQCHGVLGPLVPVCALVGEQCWSSCLPAPLSQSMALPNSQCQRLTWGGLLTKTFKNALLWGGFMGFQPHLKDWVVVLLGGLFPCSTCGTYSVQIGYTSETRPCSFSTLTFLSKEDLIPSLILDEIYNQILGCHTILGPGFQEPCDRALPGALVLEEKSHETAEASPEAFW